MGHKTVELEARDRFAGQHLNIGQWIAFVWAYEQISDPIASHPASSTNPVNIVFRIFRNVVVEDVANAFHVDTTPDHISGDQNLDLPLAETSHHAIPGRLGQVAVNQAHTSKFTA